MNSQSQADESERNSTPAEMQLQPEQNDSNHEPQTSQVAEEDSNGFVLGYN